MKKYTFSLQKTETSVMIYDNSVAKKNFKEKLKGWLIDFLNSESLVEHLREIKIYFEDEGIGSSSFFVKQLAEDFMPRIHGAYEPDKGLIIYTDWCSLFYAARGESFFLKSLAATLTHELAHCVFDEINVHPVEIFRAHEALVKKYEKKYPLFQKDTFGALLEVMNSFLLMCMDEGFAMLIDQMRHGQLVFTKKKFDELYTAAKDAAKYIIDVLKQACALDDIHEADTLIVNNLRKIERHEYTIGLHMAYTLFYFHKTDLEKDVDYVISLFADSMGKLTPRKFVQEYSKIMQANKRQPVISYEPSPYINLISLQETWQALLKKFATKQRL